MLLSLLGMCPMSSIDFSACLAVRFTKKSQHKYSPGVGWGPELVKPTSPYGNVYLVTYRSEVSETSQVRSNAGQQVYMNRGRIKKKFEWIGPGIIISTEPVRRVVWVSLRTELFKLSWDQCRLATSEEDLGCEFIEEVLKGWQDRLQDAGV